MLAHPFRTRLAIVPVLCAAWLALAGCNGGGDSEDTPSSSSSSASDKDDSTSVFPRSAVPDADVSDGNPPPSSAAKILDPGFVNADDMADPSTVDLTGAWSWKYPSVYSFKQVGSKLYGTYTEPDDPEVYGEIRGVVSGARIEMDIRVTYADHPESNFTAHKSGQIHSNDSITLVVTGGPKYMGNVQEWYRK